MRAPRGPCLCSNPYVFLICRRRQCAGPRCSGPSRGRAELNPASRIFFIGDATLTDLARSARVSAHTVEKEAVS
jgi:hypothetical protein